MHSLLFIHKILFSSTCFEHQVGVGGCLKTPTNNLPPAVSSHSSCVPTGHQKLSYRVTVPYAAGIHLHPPEDEHLRLETCREK